MVFVGWLLVGWLIVSWLVGLGECFVGLFFLKKKRGGTNILRHYGGSFINAVTDLYPDLKFDGIFYFSKISISLFFSSKFLPNF